MRIAIVHPWYLANGGAEQTVNALAQIYPEADFFTLLYCQDDLPSHLRNRKITALRINWMPAKFQLYRYMLPFYPLMFEALDLTGYELIISSDSCVTKGILIDQGAVHICYCHSPMRCLWDRHRDFSRSFSKAVKPIFTLGTHYVRQWDFSASQRVDGFIANSHNVAERIRTYYRRESTVIYPPVDTHKGYVSATHEEYYLSVGRLAEVKRLDILIHACNRLRRRLVIVGRGREEARLKAIAGPTIEFAGHAPDDVLSKLYARCRAFLFAADEDFGIVPVEAQAYGRPVIAYGRGGTLETVIPIGESREDLATGVFFSDQTVAAVEQAILQFEQRESHFSPLYIQNHARRFDSQIFSNQITSFVDQTLSQFPAARGPRKKPMPESPYESLAGIRESEEIARGASAGD
jgi:glycosyltransferase involved in cell wall biosynthesis